MPMLPKDPARRAASTARGGKKGGATRRRQVEHPEDAADPVTSNRYYTDDEAEFLRAMAAYQSRTGRRFPTWCEALAVLKSLGYARPPAPPPVSSDR